MLSPSQIDHFHTFGFVVLPGLLGPDRTETLRQEVDAALHDAYAATYDERVIDGISGHYLPLATMLTPLSTSLVCDDPVLIDAAEQLLAGPALPSIPEGVLYFAEAGWHDDDGIGGDRQVARVTGWATEHGYEITQVVTEVGSALDGKRRKFLALLGGPTATVIMVEHRDRFARFGAEYVSAALQAAGRQLVVVDNSEVDDDLVRDMTEVLTSMCARLYGKRAAANRARRAVEIACAGEVPLC